MTDAIKTLAAVVLTVLAICAIGAAYLTPITNKKYNTSTVNLNYIDQMAQIAEL